jgi:hypothetical protein
MFLNFFLGLRGMAFCLDGCARAWSLGVGREEVHRRGAVRERGGHFFLVKSNLNLTKGLDTRSGF